MIVPDEPILWLLIISLFIASFFFSGSETAFITANRFKLKARAENGEKRAELTSWVLDNLENSLVSIVIFNNITNLLFTTLLTIVFINKFGEDSGALVTSLVSVPLIFLFAESFPKAIARRNAERWAVFGSFILAPLIIVFWPVSYVFKLFIALFKLIFKFKEDNIFSPRDFENVIEAIEEQGALSEDSSDLIISTLDFNETVVRDVLTPLDKIVAYDLAKYNQKTLHKYLLETPFSRIPIYDKKIENIVGVIIVREYIHEFVKNEKVKLESVMRKPYFVFSKVSLTTMIEGFKKQNTHIAFVRNTNKQVIGMVTMEDVLEELVGQIAEPSAGLAKGKVVPHE